MSISERPGVYTDYAVSGLVRAGGAGRPAALAAAAEKGAAGTVTVVTDQGAALSAFGGGNLTALAGLLLENGAPAVYCCPVIEGDYAAAFAALMGAEEPRYMVCDSHDPEVHAALRDAIAAGDEASKYRLGVVESAETGRAELVSAAESLNSERMALVSHHERSGVPGAVAAAVCGALAGESDPALPLNGAVLRGLGDLGGNFSDGDLTLLVRGGVTPVERVNGAVSVIRGVTTRSKTGGAPDATWREISTLGVIDEVVPGIRDVLRAGFARAKNTPQTRGAIRTRVVIELENYLSREIIDSYDSVTAEVSPEDPAVCLVSFGFTVAHGLNVIRLSAKITV